MYTLLLIILIALLPVAILLFYIYRKDKLCPEPPRQLVKAFLFGVLSCFASFCLSIPFGMIGLYNDDVVTMFDCIRSAFFGAAIPEECAKLFMLWLVLRKNPYFDEKMDGIVYAVCVSLGFAGLENILYLFTNYDTYMQVGLTRALFSIPGHFCFGVLMGYYYSLVKFYPKTPQKNKILILVAPVIAHGIYNSILFFVDISSELSVVLMIVFLVFCHKLWKYSSQRIKEHLERDMDKNHMC